MSSTTRTQFVLAALLVGFTGTAAYAQPAEGPPSEDSAAIAEARRLYAEGNEHYSAGRYTLAAERFVEAYELSGRPALLFNLANTYERAGNYEKAAHYLRLYLDGGDVHDPAAVKARLQRLELTVIESRNTADDSAPTSPGTLAAPVETDPATAPVTAHRPSRVPYYVAGAGALAGGTLAIVFGLRAHSARTEIDGLCAPQGGGVICPASAESHLATERRSALVSDLGIGLAAASVATGVVYYLVTRESRPATEPGRPTLSIGASASGDGVGVVATGRF